MKVNDLKKNLNIDIAPAYFIVGEDTYLREYAYNVFVELLNPDVRDFNLNIFPDFTFVYDIISALQSYPLMDDRKIVVVKEPTKPDKEQLDCIIKYLKKPEVQSTLLVFGNDDIKELYKYGEVVNCATLSIDECIRQIELILKQQNRKIEYNASKKLAEYCLCDLQKIHIEIKKLVHYNIDGVITEKDVECLVTPSTDYKIYEFTQSLTERNVLKATTILDSLLSAGNKPLQLIQAILTQYKRMLYSLINRGTDEDIAKALGVKPYAVKKARQVAGSYSPKILKQYCESLVDLEYKSLTGQINQKDALKTAISILVVK